MQLRYLDRWRGNATSRFLGHKLTGSHAVAAQALPRRAHKIPDVLRKKCVDRLSMRQSMMAQVYFHYSNAEGALVDRRGTILDNLADFGVLADTIEVALSVFMILIGIWITHRIQVWADKMGGEADYGGLATGTWSATAQKQ